MIAKGLKNEVRKARVEEAHLDPAPLICSEAAPRGEGSEEVGEYPHPDAAGAGARQRLEEP